MEITKPNLILAGGTGLIGQHAIDYLLQHPEYVDKIYAPTRRPLALSTDSLVTLPNEEFDHSLDINATLGLICLGTTKKQAGSNEALYRIDHDLVISFAKTMKSLGVKRLGVVSSYGAKADSPSHYLKCKGEMERDLRKLGFERLVIARPGPLQGDRTAPRWDEVVLQKVLKVVKPIMLGPLENLRPIHAQTVARYLVDHLCIDVNDSDETIANYREMNR
ncbi:NAD-dependent epimerase/dehydratase family protein [Vibrio superstes]|uniref:Nucleoside-diphosphate sugar epimerase n=1 Tax=Vibrio superstes NBRC 103154 TaxID=1219062 RepID=A0A511QUI3_9VIBR|nr:NAD-dependent epimerase/dehydratase family protein [Vibrio superstes]GEM80687.1 nucleoside-diphosphate sugar epimerase [Vibrio superstes NBRC 103154]